MTRRCEVIDLGARVAEIVGMRAAGASIRRIAGQLGMSRRGVYRVLVRASGLPMGEAYATLGER